MISLEHIGQIGDSFNILTSLFAGLAFGAIIVTIKVQQQELIETREELERQKFDNKFFQMLNQFNNISNNLILEKDAKELKGKYIFKSLNEYFDEKILELYEEDIYNNTVKDNKFEYFKNIFNNFNNDYDTTFKYIFLNLYQILKYIDKNIKNENIAKEYTNLLRAQLTKYELILLAYNAVGVQNFTTNDYQKLLEKYNFFEHLRYDDFHEEEKIIKIIDSILNKYNKEAFGDNDKLYQDIQDNKS